MKNKFLDFIASIGAISQVLFYVGILVLVFTRYYLSGDIHTDYEGTFKLFKISETVKISASNLSTKQRIADIIPILFVYLGLLFGSLQNDYKKAADQALRDKEAARIQKANDEKAAFNREQSIVRRVNKNIDIITRSAELSRQAEQIARQTNSKVQVCNYFVVGALKYLSQQLGKPSEQSLVGVSLRYQILRGAVFDDMDYHKLILQEVI